MKKEKNKERYRTAKTCKICKHSKFITVRDSPIRYFCRERVKSVNPENVCDLFFWSK